MTTSNTNVPIQPLPMPASITFSQPPLMPLTPVAPEQSQPVQPQPQPQPAAPQQKDPTSTTTYTQLPIARIKKIMRADKTLTKQSSDAPFTCALITEQFIRYLVKHSMQYTLRDRRKILAYRDIANVVAEVEQFQFLADIIPQSIPRAQLAATQQQLQPSPISTTATTPPEVSNNDLPNPVDQTKDQATEQLK
eukprot:Partr_v1_DN24524_c1_g1_i1_m19803 putative polymerase (DNA-directed), epsilon 4, accessory subunit